jgi:hypothetical protein
VLAAAALFVALLQSVTSPSALPTNNAFFDLAGFDIKGHVLPYPTLVVLGKTQTPVVNIAFIPMFDGKCGVYEIVDSPKIKSVGFPLESIEVHRDEVKYISEVMASDDELHMSELSRVDYRIVIGCLPNGSHGPNDLYFSRAYRTSLLEGV